MAYGQGPATRHVRASAPCLVAASARPINTHSLVQPDAMHRYARRREIFDLYGEIDGNLGIVRMNREHRYNQLTANMID